MNPRIPRIVLAALLLAVVPQFAIAQTVTVSSSGALKQAKKKPQPVPTPTPNPVLNPLDPDYVPTTGSTSWGTAANWNPSGVPSGADVAVVFFSPTGNQTVTLDGARTIGSLTLTNNGGNNWTLSNGTGGSLTFDVTSGNASATINGTGGGTNTISGSITLNDTLDLTVNNTVGTATAGALSLTGSMGGSGGFIKDGLGKVTLSTATKAYTGSTTINSGVVRLTFSGRPTGTSDITVNSGGQLLLDQNLQAWGTLGTAGAILTLNGAGPSSAGALRDDGTGLSSLANNISLATDSTIFVSTASATFQLDGIISNSGALTKTSLGSLSLTGANTYSGGTVLTTGTLNINNGGTSASNSAIGTGALTISAGTTIDNTSAGAITLLTNNAQTWSGNFTFTGSNDLNLGTGAVTLTGSRSVAVSASNLTVGGAIGDGGSGFSLTKTGAGTLTLSGVSTYSGGTVLSGGTLALGNDSALGSGGLSTTASNVTIQSSDATAHTFSNAVSLGGVNTIFGAGGNLTFGALTLTGGNRTVDVENAKTTVSSIGQDSGSRVLTKTGAGALIVTGTTSYLGNTDVQAGILAIGGSNVTGSNQQIDGGVIGMNGSYTRTLGSVATAVRWLDSGGFAAFGTNATWGNAANSLTVNIGGAGATEIWASTTNFLANNKTFVLGSSISNGTVTFQNGIDLNSATRTVQVDHSAVVGAGTDAVLSGVISSATGVLNKTGTGILSLTNNNTYGGGTTINGGTLLANNGSAGSGTGSGAVTVNNGGTLGGGNSAGTTGFINAGANNVTVGSGGTLSPGNSPGILHVTAGALSLQSNSTYLVDVNGGSTGAALGAGSLYDQTIVTGNISLAGNLSLTLGATPLVIGDKFFIALSNGTVSGTFANTTLAGTVYTLGGDRFLVNYSDTGDLTPGDDISLTVTAVPEPSTWIGGSLALAALAFSQRRRFARARAK